MTDSIVPFFYDKDDASMRRYVTEVASHFFEEALHDIDDSQITTGLTKDTILLVMKPIYDTYMNIIQISEDVINSKNVTDETAYHAYANAMNFMQALGDITMEKTLSSFISFNDNKLPIDKFLDNTKHNKIFNLEILNAFIDMGSSLQSFEDLLSTKTDSDEMKDIKELLNTELNVLMYGNKHNSH